MSKRFSVAVSEEILDRIDRKRGLQSRASYAGKAIQDGLENSPSALLDEITRLINFERQARGLPPL